MLSRLSSVNCLSPARCLQALVGDLAVVQIQRREIDKRSQNRHPLIADARLQQVQFSKIGKRLQMDEPGIGETAMPQNQLVQRSRAFQLLEPRVPHIGSAQIEPLQLGKLCQMNQGRIGDIRLSRAIAGQAKLNRASSAAPVSVIGAPKRSRSSTPVRPARPCTFDIGVLQTEPLKRLHPAQRCQPGIGNGRLPKIEVDEIDQPRQMLQAEIAHFGSFEIQLPKPGQSGQLRHVRIGDRTGRERNLDDASPFNDNFAALRSHPGAQTRARLCRLRTNARRCPDKDEPRLRQRLLKRVDSRLRSSCVADIHLTKRLQLLQRFQSRIGDASAIQAELLERLHLLEIRESGIGNTGAHQIQLAEIA